MYKTIMLIIMEAALVWICYLVGVVISDSWVIGEWRAGSAHLISFLCGIIGVAMALDFVGGNHGT